MSQENVDAVRSMLEPFTGINVAEIDLGAEAIRETVERDYAPDVELRTLASGIGAGVGELYRGRDGLIRYLREWLEPFSEYRVDNLDYIEAGDCVLVPTHQRGVGAGSGARVEIELTTLYGLRDGQITRIHQFDTLEEASMPPGCPIGGANSARRGSSAPRPGALAPLGLDSEGVERDVAFRERVPHLRRRLARARSEHPREMAVHLVAGPTARREGPAAAGADQLDLRRGQRAPGAVVQGRVELHEVGSIVLQPRRV